MDYIVDRIGAIGQVFRRIILQNAEHAEILGVLERARGAGIDDQRQDARVLGVRLDISFGPKKPEGGVLVHERLDGDVVVGGELLLDRAADCFRHCLDEFGAGRGHFRRGFVRVPDPDERRLAAAARQTEHKCNDK
jgi:hypothetical protein